MAFPAPLTVNLREAELLEFKSIVPLSVSELPPTVTNRLALMVTDPLPRLRLFVPVKAKSPVQLCALLVERVTAELLVLSIVPPEIVKVPVPRAELVPPDPLLLMLRVPELSVMPPLKVFAPDRVMFPVPLYARTPVLPALEF